MATPCDYIAENMGELFECLPVNGRTRIRTPYLYPDGDIIDLFLTDDGFPTTLTDFGDTLGWLWTQTAAKDRTVRQQRLIQDVCLTHGVELYRGMLTVRVKDPAALSDAVTRLSQAALRVSDLWFTFRSQSAASVNDDVEEFLRARNIGFDRGERLVGRSGRYWRVDFHTRMPKRSALLNVLSTANKPSARRMVEHIASGWLDLSYLNMGPENTRFVTLFVDQFDVWTPEDFGLVEQVSDVAYWSRRGDLEELLVS